MGDAQRKTKLRIGGMTCVGCQKRIEGKLRKTRGISAVRVSYNDGTAHITYNEGVISPPEITKAVESLGYRVFSGKRSGQNTALGILIIAVAVFIILKHLGLTNVVKNFPVAESGMGYGMLFVIGLLTSVHCIAMCGGINISQCIPAAAESGSARIGALKPSLLYNLSRVVSYTVIGAIIGAIGSAISFSGGMKGVVQLAAGVFMVIMGLNMLGLFPGLRRIVPRLPRVFARKIDEEKEKRKSPIVIGLLNGLMPCGPLQAMQLYALSTGSVFKGALSMLLFSLGTLPLMFGLGALSSLLSKRFTSKVMTAGAALVIFLGLFMFTNGMNLSGISFTSILPTSSGAADADAGAEIAGGTQVVTSELASGRYPPITVQKGTPVKWVINAAAGTLNGCNRSLVIPEYGIEYDLVEGENVINFTPEESGAFPYSCWMGMIRSTITVT
jgi:sulfite exporter TauE/SafE/copper chaperone CopZ